MDARLLAHWFCRWCDTVDRKETGALALDILALPKDATVPTPLQS